MKTIIKTYLTIESPAFKNNDFIPKEYSCFGGNVNPPLVIHDLPGDTESLAIIVYDPDAPGGIFDHWVMWNIPPARNIEPGDVCGRQGKNSKRESSYLGPCPPPGKVHHYHFKIYALDTMLDLPEGATKNELSRAMEDHIVGTGEMIGLFKS